MALTTIFPVISRKGSTFRVQKAKNAVALTEQEARQLLADAGNDAFAVQATLNESYNFNADITDNPVEEGSDVTDNINPRPLEISLTMKQSDTPISLGSAIRGAAVSAGSAAGSELGSLGRVAGGFAGGELSRLLRNESARRGLAQTCYEQFRKMFEERNLITVQTGLDIFPNMAIQSINFSRNQSTGRAIDFVVTLRQIRIVRAQQITINVAAEQSVSDQASATQNDGRKKSKELTDPRASWAANIFDDFFG